MTTRQQHRNVVILIALILVFLAAEKCSSQTYDLKQVEGHGYLKRVNADGFITLTDSTVTIKIEQGAWMFYKVKINEVTKKPVIIKAGNSTAYVLEILGQRSFIEVKEQAEQLDGIWAEIRHVTRYQSDNEQEVYYYCKRL